MDGQDKWSNGGTVENSDGTYSQSNTAAEITTAIADFVDTRSTVAIKSFLHADTGSTTPELDTLTITYDSSLPDPSLPVSFDLEGFVYDKSGPISGSQLRIRPYLNGFINVGIFHAYEWSNLGAVTTSDGFFESNCYVPPSGEYWELQISKQRYKVELPSGIIEGQTVDIKDTTLTALED